MMEIPFQVINWAAIPKLTHSGASGDVIAQTLHVDAIRVRIVEYTPGYMADHWCQKGHIVHCLEGEFVSELESGEKYTLTKGMTYIVSDHLSSHRSSTNSGVKLLIIDGDFLQALPQEKS